MNIECNTQTLQQLNHIFRYNDAILRRLVTSVDKAITKNSLMMEKKEELNIK